MAMEIYGKVWNFMNLYAILIHIRSEGIILDEWMGNETREVRNGLDWLPKFFWQLNSMIHKVY